jgi:7,8-dihydroneopterin aldolase/epimerase/oxygenase
LEEHVSDTRQNQPANLQGLVPESLRPRSARIFLDSLEVMADIGFHDFEIGAPQRLLVTVEIWLDHVPSADSDDPSLAWDYDFLREQV